MSFLNRQLCNNQRSNDWKQLRKRLITATDIANYKDGKDFLNSKFNKITNKEANRAMEHGNLTEDISRIIFNKMYDVNVQECGLISHSEYDHIAASPDGYFYFQGNKKPHLIEIKNVYKRVIKNLIPYKYWVQMQIQLFCTELQYCYYFETSIKFKEIITEDDKQKYKYWGLCKNELKNKGRFWYLDNYYCNKVERNDKWLSDNLQNFLDMYNKLKRTYSSRGRKRKFNEMNEESNQTDYYLNEHYMINYVNNNTFSDFMNMYALKKYSNINQDMNPFLRGVTNYNKEWSRKLRQNLVSNYKTQYSIKIIPEKIFLPYDVQLDLHKLTLDAMNNNYDIIINPYLIDLENKMFLNTFAFVKGKVLIQETNISNIRPNIYYPYIFKKKRLIVFANRPNKLTNGSNMREIKCSALYNIDMLNKFQTTKIHKAYILGFGYQFKNMKIDFNISNELFKNKVQYVSSYEEPELQQKCKSALKWLNICRKYGKDWDIFNLDTTVPVKFRRLLLPNVCNKDRWYKIKKQLAEEQDDVGLFWQIGSEKRRELHFYGIYSWKDEQFLEYIDSKFKKNAGTMKEMIRMSKDNDAPGIYLPNGKIKQKQNKWGHPHRLKFYVDFETINTSVYHMEIIYLIGMVVEFPNGDFNYISYFVPELTLENEMDIIERWMIDMKRLTRRYARGRYTPNIFCWGNAETQMLNSALKRIQSLNRDSEIYDISFIDMCQEFKQQPILIKGAKEGFGLKNILKKMVENELIEEVKYEVVCNRGDQSIICALEYYNRKDNDIKNSLIHYNEIDCIALMKIVNKVREYC